MKTMSKNTGCAACGAATADTAEATSAVAILTEAASVYEMTSGRQYTPTSHDVDRLMANYRLKANIDCSLPDKTPHQHGHVVRTRCGLTLNIGNSCGKKLITGLKTALKRDRELATYEQRLFKIRSVRDVLGRAEAAAQRVVALRHFVHGLQTRIPDLHDILAYTARTPRANRIDVHVRALDGSSRWTTQHVAGIELFNSASMKSSDRLRELAQIVEAACEARPIPSEAEAKQIVNQINKLLDISGETERWATGCEAFFTEPNMTAALLLGSVDGVRVEGATFVTATGERIGLRGRSA